MGPPRGGLLLRLHREQATAALAAAVLAADGHMATADDQHEGHEAEREKDKPDPVHVPRLRRTGVIWQAPGRGIERAP